jgi:hypothetical protein
MTKSTKQQKNKLLLSKKLVKKARIALGKFVYYNCNPSKCAYIFGVQREVAKYWEKKVSVPNFHPGTHGGLRRMKFSPEEYDEINSLLWEHCKRKPTSRLAE